MRGLALLYLQNGLELFVQVHLRPNLLLYEYTTEWALIVAVPAWDLLKEVTIIFSNSTIVRPQVKSSEGTQLHTSTENCIKDLLSMAGHIRTRPSFPLSQSIPSGRFHKPLILHQRADRLKRTVTEH